jgi:hypothetical protein
MIKEKKIRKQKIKELMKGCGFTNCYKEVCGKTARETDRRQKYPTYLCYSCHRKIAQVRRELKLIEAGERG